MKQWTTESSFHAPQPNRISHLIHHLTPITMAITFKKKYKVSGFELSVIFSVVLGSSVASSISTIFPDSTVSASLFRFSLTIFAPVRISRRLKLWKKIRRWSSSVRWSNFRSLPNLESEFASFLFKILGEREFLLKFSEFSTSRIHTGLSAGALSDFQILWLSSDEF